MERLDKYHTRTGVDIARDMLAEYDRNIVVYFDPDVDGMVSGYLVCKYLSLEGKSFSWYVNTDRHHDWSLPMGRLLDLNIIAVDFMIPVNTISDIVKYGANIISIDHHINRDVFIDVKCLDGLSRRRGIVINNQYPFEEEDGRFLSGAGVVFEVLRELNPKMDTLENRALVGLTLLSDVCNIENPIARGYLEDLYNHKCKGYIKYLIENTIGEVDYGFGVPRLDRKYVDYIFSPAINSALRFNKESEVVEFFLGSGKLNLAYHKRQKDLVKAMVEKAKVVEFSNLRVVYINDWDIETEEDINVFSNFIGLLASKYLDGKKSVIAYVITKNQDGQKEVRRASFRGNINGTDYLSPISEVLSCAGHPSAFGILKLFPTKELFKTINQRCIEAEGSNSNTKMVATTRNLSIFAHKKGKEIAEYNMYCLSQNSKYIRYLGRNIKVIKEGAAYRKYKVDGIDITSFDLSLDFTNGLIYPILERGYIYYYLQGDC